MTHYEIAELGPKGAELANDLAENRGEIFLTSKGKTLAKLVRVDTIPDTPDTNQPRPDGKVLYKGRWMIPAAAERERSIEHLRGSVKILGDIVSPIDDVEWDALK